MIHNYEYVKYFNNVISMIKYVYINEKGYLNEIFNVSINVIMQIIDMRIECLG